MFDERSFSSGSFDSRSWAGLLDGIIQRVEEATAGFIRKRRRFKLDDRPTDEQIKAERIRLGIIEARQERKRILNKAKATKNNANAANELRLYAYLLQEEIKRLQGEYEALKASLESQGQMIRSVVITRAVMAMIEEEIRQAQQEEDDISFLLAMLAEM